MSIVSVSSKKTPRDRLSPPRDNQLSNKRRKVSDLDALNYLEQIFILAESFPGSKLTMLALDHFIKINVYIVDYLDGLNTLVFADSKIRESFMIIESQINKKDPSVLSLLTSPINIAGGMSILGGIFKAFDWMYLQNYWKLIKYNYETIKHELLTITEIDRFSAVQVYGTYIKKLYRCFKKDSISCNLKLVLRQKFNGITKFFKLPEYPDEFPKLETYPPVAVGGIINPANLNKMAKEEPDFFKKVWTTGVAYLLPQIETNTRVADSVIESVQRKLEAINTGTEDLISGIITFAIALIVCRTYSLFFH